jgi:hypothetical protein
MSVHISIDNLKSKSMTPLDRILILVLEPNGFEKTNLYKIEMQHEYWSTHSCIHPYIMKAK